ncbi:MAG: hypothetical protein RSA09_00180 [Acinetobacter sp.]
MKEATMLYKKGTMLKTNDGEFDYIIVDADEVSANLKKGWHKTTKDALANKRPTKVNADELD